MSAFDVTAASATLSGTTATVSWTAPSYINPANGASILPGSYTVSIVGNIPYNALTQTQVTVLTSPATFSNLTPGQPYTFNIVPNWGGANFPVNGVLAGPVTPLYTALARSSTSNTITQTSVPSGVAPTGSLGNNGALTLGTALATTYSNGIYLYFPAGALYSGSPAGSYWTVMSSTTVGVVYANTLSGPAIIPAVLVPIVATGPGAYTGATSAVVVSTITVPPNSFGPNGAIRISHFYSTPNNANPKTMVLAYAGTTVDSYNIANGVYTGFQNIIANRGILTAQVATATATVGLPSSPNGNSPGYFSINTAVAQNITLTITSSVATDYFVNESVIVEVLQG